jgi:hypothetical protein
MLSRELMGLGALGILWVNTLLVMAAAWLELRRIAGRQREMRALSAGQTGPGLVRGRVLSGDGPGGALASRLIDQVGRAGSADEGARRSIRFADRAYRSEIHGGRVELEGGRVVRVEPAAGDVVEVWAPREALERAAACPSDGDFDAAYGLAGKARGYLRTVAVRAAAGDEVWLVGEVQGGAGGELVLATPAKGAHVVATTDPLADGRAKVARIAAFLVAVPLAAGVCTAVALVPPVFGTVSTIGGALGLAYFLLVQPAGVSLREAVRFPHRSILRGAWTRGGAPTTTAAGGSAAASA